VVGFGIAGLAVTVALALLGGLPRAEAQFKGLAEESGTGEDHASPGFQDFCVGNACPGQTCDEVNDQCVGTVTLQPAAGQPLVGLTATELMRFNLGKVQFERTFTALEGLGPAFNQDSCASCHSTPVGGSGTINVTRFGEITIVGTDLVFDPLTQFGGSLLNKEGIAPGCAEEIPVPPTNHAAFRITNSTLGFGLVEAIPDGSIEFNALNPPPGVSGRVHVAPVLEAPPATVAGRFGWKSQLGTVLSFTADAMLQEMGLTSRVFPEENPPNNDFVKLAACDTVPDPEDVPDAAGNEFVDLTTDFQRFLAPPPQTPRSGMTGEALFEAVGCADCHVNAFTAVGNGDDEVEDAIYGKAVHAYSDFLLHDMGGNGDFIAQGDAGLTEIRTTPLWGLRLRDPLWHDGRVAGGTFDFRVFNAVLLHDTQGSEAQASAQAYLALPFFDQMEIVSFLDSLGRREFDMNGDGLVTDADVLLVDDCAATGGPFTADDLCAIADPNQSGFVDAADLALFNVALGLLDADEDEDEDGDSEGSSSDDDDDSGDDGMPRSDFVVSGARGTGGTGGMQTLNVAPAPESATADGSGGGNEVAPQPQRQRGVRRTASRRGL
jgi:CxxC motif-containing protein (DUF1111 family)